MPQHPQESASRAQIAMLKERLARIGSEVVRHACLRDEFSWPRGRRAAVSLTFDDARRSQLSVGIPLLNRYGFKATFYVLSARVRRRLSRWQDAVASGHEIGNHSMHHPCTGNFPWARRHALEDYTLSDMAAELDGANAQIEAMLGIRAVSFAYPGGQKYVGRGEDVKSYVPLVARRFLSGRGWRDEGANDPRVCDFAQLLAMELDGLGFEQLMAQVRRAVKMGSWLVLCGHKIGSGGPQTTRVETLAAFCEYARKAQNELWVTTMAEVARYVAARRADAGFHRPGTFYDSPAGRGVGTCLRECLAEKEVVDEP